MPTDTASSLLAIIVLWKGTVRIDRTLNTPPIFVRTKVEKKAGKSCKKSDSSDHTSNPPRNGSRWMLECRPMQGGLNTLHFTLRITYSRWGSITNLYVNIFPGILANRLPRYWRRPDFEDEASVNCAWRELRRMTVSAAIGRVITKLLRCGTGHHDEDCSNDNIQIKYAHTRYNKPLKESGWPDRLAPCETRAPCRQTEHTRYSSTPWHCCARLIFLHIAHLVAHRRK